ncbi:hypothetical protein IWW39_002617 [Coemansia spiralis]|uniref:RSE1/DDB1/CPSF1 C-terminal domain-containing protein n=1 Tax=Coemansia spiralis TaxID=417178 RepID=A0A9W8GMT2_9FUNG|nr:hypothetical protein IWW39_002617 [Coemansia spiralis]
MSGFASFATAWEASTGSTRKVRAYLGQTLNSGLIKCAALGKLRPDHSSGGEPDMLAAVGSLLCLFRVDGPGMGVTNVCSTPVYSNVLDIACLHAPANSQLPASINEHGGELCAVLSENGVFALVRVERFHAKDYRIRLLSETRAYMGLDDGSCLRMLRKLVTDPLSRLLCLVSWIDYIEFVYLDWADSESTGSQCPVTLGVRLNVEVGGAICDAAILAPAKAELQRVLLVAAVVDNQRQSVFLHLYESWVRPSGSPSVVLLAKLPLPLNTTTPLHIVPLPEHPECFLLVTENEVAFVSALQILSGDVYLYRQNLPQLPSGDCDLVKAFSVAGTTVVSPSSTAGTESPHSRRTIVPRSPLLDSWLELPLSEARRSSEMVASQVAQKVYLATQGGALLLVTVSSRPSILLTKVCGVLPSAEDASQTRASWGNVLLFLGAEDPAADVAQLGSTTSVSAVDYFFASGDSLDHSVIRVAGMSTPDTNADTTADAVVPTRLVRRVLTNQSPMIDFVLGSNMAYWTSGRTPGGAIHHAQFGHATGVEELIEIRANKAEDRAATLQLWHFTLPLVGPCLVLQRAQAAVAIAKDEGTGEWQVYQALQQMLVGKCVLFIGVLGPSDLVLCISSDCVEIWSMTGLSENSHATSLKLASAQPGEVFTHGAVATSLRSGHSRAILSVESLVDQPTEPPSLDSHSKRRHSFIRVIAIPDNLDTRVLGHAAVEMQFAHEISCLRSLTLGDNIYVAVGTYEPRLHVLRLDTELVAMGLDLPLSLPDGASKTDRMDVDCTESLAPGRASQVINDIYILCSIEACCILVGLRDGTLLQLTLDGSLVSGTMDEERRHIANVTRDIVGMTPVRFASVPVAASADSDNEDIGAVAGSQRAVIVAGSMFIADLKPLGQVTITACFGGGHLLDRVRFVIPATDKEGASDTTKQYYAVDDTSDALSLLSIDLAPQCHIDELAISCEPRRVIRDSETNLLVVAGVLAQSPGTPFPTSCLSVLDPRDGRIHAECKLRPGELVHALETWHIHGSRSYRYICVGTGMYPPTSDGRSGALARAKSGRLIIFNLKAAKRKSQPKTLTTDPNSTNSGYELKYVWESEREGSVSALAHLGDKYLVVAAGSSCLVLKLDVVQKRLIECCEIPLRFPATSLHVRESDIVVGSQREGVHVLRFTPAASSDSYDELRLLHSARYGVYTTDVGYLSSDLVLGVSSDGYVYAMGIPSHLGEFALDYIMGIHLGSECTRIRLGSPVRRLRRPEQALAWSADNSDSRVLINSVDGALWTLLRITDDAFVLLCQLETAMVAMGPTHAAYPLLTVGGSISRARRSSKLPVVGIVDGAFSTTFIEGLTEAEQHQVVQSSPELQRLALQLFSNSNCQSQCRAEPDGAQIAVEYITQLIYGLGQARVC